MTGPDQDLVGQARACALLTRARALVTFVGDGRPVTAKGVLRRAEIPAACAAAGLPDPGRVVTAAHVPALHRAWVAAQGAGMIAVGHQDARANPTTDEPLDQWRSAVTALLRAESGDDDRTGATVVCRTVLDVLSDRPGPGDPEFGDAVATALGHLPLDEQITVPYAFRRGLFPEVGALELLGECGAVDPESRAVTSLGRWARRMLDDPPPAAPTDWADDDVLQVRIDLDRFRPPVWRRLRLPADITLAELHEIIQTVFEWDDDHLHVFTVDGRSYADPEWGLDGAAAEDELHLAAALPRAGARLRYRYDLGDCWDHTVLLESGGPDATCTRPVCIGGRGDAPVEDWVPPDCDPDAEETPPALPFDRAELDRRLAERWHYS